MGQHILPGDPPIALTLKRSPRARRVSLRVSGVDGRVTLTLPRGISESQAIEFAHEKSGWLRSQLARRPDVILVRDGVEVPVEGETRRISLTTGRRIQIDARTLYIPGPQERMAARTRSWLRTLARDRLVAASDHYAARLDLPYSRITLRDTRSRWGSCSSSGGLSYSWRLILAPPDVLRYVAAHEVAHLKEMNHSAAFWDVVERLMPDYQTHRGWLRQNGTALHRYRFES